MEPECAGQVELSSPIIELNNTCLVPAASSVGQVAELDRPGVRIGVTNHLSDRGSESATS